MPTRLDERDMLIKLLDALNGNDIQKLKIFISGLEAGKAIQKEQDPNDELCATVEANLQYA